MTLTSTEAASLWNTIRSNELAKRIVRKAKKKNLTEANTDPLYYTPRSEYRASLIVIITLCDNCNTSYSSPQPMLHEKLLRGNRRKAINLNDTGLNHVRHWDIVPKEVHTNIPACTNCWPTSSPTQLLFNFDPQPKEEANGKDEPTLAG